jgi:hypothetical protein
LDGPGCCSGDDIVLSLLAAVPFQALVTPGDDDADE